MCISRMRNLSFVKGDIMEDVNGRPVQAGQEPEGRLPPTTYTLPGVLHFIQHEWTKFERERSRWDVERAELQARIAYLQGERRGQENLKHDLVRRIKMLEYALRQERLKYHRLKYNCDPPVHEPKGTLDGDGKDEAPASALAAAAAVELRPGRQLLRQYLQEIGYTENMLEMRTAQRNRIFSGVELLTGAAVGSGAGFQPITSDVSPKTEDVRVGRAASSSPPPGSDRVLDTPAVFPPRPSEPVQTKPLSTPAQATTSDNRQQQPLAQQDMSSEAAAMGSFDFLQAEDDEDDDSDGEGGKADDEAEDDRGFGAENALKDFDFLNNFETEDAGTGPESRAVATSGLPTPAQEPLLNANDSYRENHASSGAPLLEKPRGGRKKISARPGRSELQKMFQQLTDGDKGGDVGPDGGGAGGEMGSAAYPSLFGAPSSGSGRKSPAQTGENLEMLGLGELAGLSVSNEGEGSYEKTASQEQRKVWNPKYSLKSHFDCVRSVKFHPKELLLLTASEDHTVKLWNLEKATSTKKNTVPEIEPIHTFRGHKGAVLSCAFSHDGEHCFSAGTDCKLARWCVPSAGTDLYSPYESDREGRTFFEGHTDAVWDLAVHSSHSLVASASADGRCCLWNYQKASPLVNTLTRPTEAGTPTCVDFVRNEPGQVVVGYTSAQAVLFDYETSKAVCLFDSLKADGGTMSQINKVVCHPTLEITVAALEDRLIQFLDNRSGQLIHSMVAHLDAVTSLSIDPNGLYLLSGSHDCSLRLWNMESRTCVQEMTSHRKKHDESIFSVAFHPSRGYFASGGADAIAKVFV